MAIISLSNGEIHKYTYSSPSIFSFKKNSGELLNWHRDNILSLISQFEIQAITVKKTERESFINRPKNSDIFKLYLEGILLSLAGSIGLPNRHFYKMDIINILNDPSVFETEIDTLIANHSKANMLGSFTASERKALNEVIQL